MAQSVFLAEIALLTLLALSPASRADDQKAVAALKKLGADIERDPQRPGKPIIRIDLTMKKVKDADLAFIKDLKDLQTLGLAFTGITDAGLAHLKDLENLHVLVLWETKVTDKGLTHLKGLKKLTTLNVKDTKVTAKGVADLKKTLPSLDVIR
jgi:hypothetical protein